MDTNCHYSAQEDTPVLMRIVVIGGKNEQGLSYVIPQNISKNEDFTKVMKILVRNSAVM